VKNAHKLQNIIWINGAVILRNDDR